MTLINHIRLRTAAYLTLFLLVSGGPVLAENRTALLIGVGDYGGVPGLNNLPGIEEDLRLMSDRLLQLGFQVSVSRNPTLGQAQQAVDDFGNRLRTRQGIGVFYFSGHGGESSGNNFLFPSRANLTAGRPIESEALCAQRILNRMHESGNTINLVFLDCCRNEFQTGSRGGLAPMQADGVFIGFATANNKTARAGANGSLYTKFLAENITKKNLSVTDMHTMVTKQVRAAGGDQNPFQYSGLDEICYLGNTPTAADGTVRNVTYANAPAPMAGRSRTAEGLVDHLALKSAAAPVRSGAKSSIYLCRYDGKIGLVSLQFLPGDLISGAMFLPDRNREVRIYGENKVAGRMTLSLWESGTPMDGCVVTKLRGSNDEVIWMADCASGKKFQFDRQTKRVSTPAKSAYTGMVGSSTVTMALDWANNGTVTGLYRSMASGKTYQVTGDNTLEGFLYLDEFTNGELSARMLLAKTYQNGKLTWSGSLFNVNGPRRRVEFRR